MTTIKLSGGDFGGDSMLVRCNLAQASAPIEISADKGRTWSGTQYQCADASHTTNGLIRIGREIAARELEMPAVECDAEELD